MEYREATQKNEEPFKIAPNWKEPRRPSIVEQIKNV